MTQDTAVHVMQTITFDPLHNTRQDDHKEERCSNSHHPMCSWHRGSLVEHIFLHNDAVVLCSMPGPYSKELELLCCPPSAQARVVSRKPDTSAPSSLVVRWLSAPYVYSPKLYTKLCR